MRSATVAAGLLALGALAGCRIGDGDGQVEGVLFIEGCTGSGTSRDPYEGPFKLDPEFFAAETSWTGRVRATFSYAPGSDGGRVHGVVLGSAPQWGVLLIKTNTDSIPQRVSADLRRIEEGFSVDAPATAPADAQPEAAAEATI